MKHEGDDATTNNRSLRNNPKGPGKETERELKIRGRIETAWSIR